MPSLRFCIYFQHVKLVRTWFWSFYWCIHFPVFMYGQIRLAGCNESHNWSFFCCYRVVNEKAPLSFSSALALRWTTSSFVTTSSSLAALWWRFGCNCGGGALPFPCFGESLITPLPVTWDGLVIVPWPIVVPASSQWYRVPFFGHVSGGGLPASTILWWLCHWNWSLFWLDPCPTCICYLLGFDNYLGSWYEGLIII